MGKGQDKVSGRIHDESINEKQKEGRDLTFEILQPLRVPRKSDAGAMDLLVSSP